MEQILQKFPNSQRYPRGNNHVQIVYQILFFFTQSLGMSNAVIVNTVYCFY